METLEKQHDPLMGFYFPCSHCKQKYVSAECVQEHSLNCHRQASFLNPKIGSYSSFHSALEGFQFHSQNEPEDEYAEDGHTDGQDKTKESTLRSPVEICQNEPNHKVMELETIRPEPKIFGVSKDLNSIQNRESTSKGVQHQHEHCLILEPNYLCETCGKCFASGASFIHHMRSHRQPAPGFQCCFPGCVETFKSTVARWYHHKTHPSGAWNECEWRPRMLKKNQPPKNPQTTTTMTESEHLFVDNQDIKHQPMAHNNNEESSNTGAISSTDGIQSEDPAQVVSCCYPGCSTNFSSKFELWIHQKTHPEGLWNGIEEISGIVGQNQTSEDSPSINMPVIVNGGTKNQLMGQPFIGRRLVGLKITGHRKVIVKEIIPNHVTALQASQYVQINNSDKSDLNIPQGSAKGELSPGKTLLLTCGICEESFENFGTLICHMLTTHPGPEQSQAKALGEIGTPVDNSFGSVQFSCKGDQIPVEVKAETGATSNLSEKKFNGRKMQRSPVLRYPVVKIGDNKYHYCGFPDCDAVFSNRHARYKHHKKVHGDAYRSMLTNLALHRLFGKKANETSRPEQSQAEALEEIGTPVDNSFGSVQFSCKGYQIPAEVKAETQATSHLSEKKFNGKTLQRGPVLRYPIVKIGDNKYHYCGFPDCDAVFSDRHARYKHHKKVHGDAYRSMLTNLALHRLSGKKANETSSTTQFEGNSDKVQKTAMRGTL